MLLDGIQKIGISIGRKYNYLSCLTPYKCVPKIKKVYQITWECYVYKIIIVLHRNYLIVSTETSCYIHMSMVPHLYLSNKLLPRQVFKRIDQRQSIFQTKILSYHKSSWNFYKSSFFSPKVTHTSLSSHKKWILFKRHKKGEQ